MIQNYFFILIFIVFLPTLQKQHIYYAYNIIANDSQTKLIKNQKLHILLTLIKNQCKEYKWGRGARGCIGKWYTSTNRRYLSTPSQIMLCIVDTLK